MTDVSPERYFPHVSWFIGNLKHSFHVNKIFSFQLCSDWCQPLLLLQILLNCVLQDGVHREMWSSDTAFQWEIPENPARHSRWVSSPLFYITLASPRSFLSRKIITFAMRNLLSNSIMVIPHLRSAGQLDRLCTPLFLTPEGSCLTMAGKLTVL